MVCKKIISVFAACAVLSIAQAGPDSAGIVEMTNGLAYGGIPYGSVTGMVAKYNRQDGRQVPFLSQQRPQPAPSMVLAMRSRRPGVPTYNGILEPGKPVQIFSHPAVVAPGVVGMMHQVGYQ